MIKYLLELSKDIKETILNMFKAENSEKRKRNQQRSKNNKIGQSWTEKLNNLNEKFLYELKRKLEMIEEILNERENW